MNGAEFGPVFAFPIMACTTAITRVHKTCPIGRIRPAPSVENGTTGITRDHVGRVAVGDRPIPRTRDSASQLW